MHCHIEEEEEAQLEVELSQEYKFVVFIINERKA